MLKLGEMLRISARKKARLEEKRNSLASVPSLSLPVSELSPQVTPKMLEEVREQVIVAKKMAEDAFNAPKLVSSGRAEELRADAVEKEARLLKMEVALTVDGAELSVVDGRCDLNVFNRAVIVLSACVEGIKVRKWYVVAGVVALAVLFFLVVKLG